MVRTKTKTFNRVLSMVLALVVALALIVTVTTTAKADSSTATYDAPTEALGVDPNIITGTAHRAASPILGMMGLNAVSGFGMINGAAPTDLASAQTKAALGIWGTSINDNPDPYYWNYFYNFYVDAYPELGLEKSNDALLNPSVAASPGQADSTLVEEYGNISVSLSTRPEVVIGTATKGQPNSDTHGYDSQLETIHNFPVDSAYYHEGDENYNPSLVAYTFSTLVDMISSAKQIGAAMDQITIDTNKTGRYADENGFSSYIADEYESFIYGLQAYILSKIDTKKTVAIVKEADATTNTFTLADPSTQEATSSNRYVEYTDIVADNIAETLGTSVDADQLAAADVIILSNFNSEGFTDATGQAVSFYELLQGQPSYNENQIIIENYPSALYGITMNSVENAMGMAYITSYMYSDNPNVNLDPVSMCAYYYQKFYHISDINNLREAIAINFSSVTLPEGMAGTLSDDYSAAEIEAQIAAGADYYNSNPDVFANTYIGYAGWAPYSEHTMEYIPEVPATVEADGSAAYFQCTSCGLKFADEAGTIVVSDEDLVIPQLKDLSNAEVTLKYTSLTYNGNARTPAATVKLGDETLTKDVDYVLTYENNTNAGTAVVYVDGIGDYAGTAQATFKIKAKAITPTVTLSKTSLTYNGNVRTPSVTVKDGSTTLTKNTDYTVSYASGRKNVGTYKVTVKLKGNYSGSASASFKIVKAANKVTKVTPASKSFKAADLQKAAKSFTLKATTKASAKTTFSLTSVPSKAKKYITVSSAGKVTLKKGLPKGTYTIKVKVTAKATTNYKAATLTKSIKITVK